MSDGASSRGCPICRETRCEKLRRQQFALPNAHPMQTGYDLVHCTKCGFCYADTTVTQADYDDYYTRLSKYVDVATSTGAGNAPWDAERLATTADALALVLADRDARIVDIGCANGGLLRALKERGYRNLLGIDPAPACAQQTARIAGVPAVAGSLGKLPDGIGQFDGVLLSHVMEHVSDLNGSMETVREMLTPNGVVYVEVPDASRYREFIAAPFQDINTEHINHFTPIALDNFMRLSGFERISGGSKTFASPPPFRYPAIFGFFRLATAKSTRDCQHDDASLGLMKDYLHNSQQMMSAMDRRLRESLAGVPEVIVWGYG